jgi:hypothetical protein
MPTATIPFMNQARSRKKLVGGWANMTQAQLSRIENGQPIYDLWKLIYWAQTLGIPGQYLWFDLPGEARQPNVGPTQEHSRFKLPDGTCTYQIS